MVGLTAKLTLSQPSWYSDFNLVTLLAPPQMHNVVSPWQGDKEHPTILIDFLGEKPLHCHHPLPPSNYAFNRLCRVGLRLCRVGLRQPMDRDLSLLLLDMLEFQGYLRTRNLDPLSVQTVKLALTFFFCWAKKPSSRIFEAKELICPQPPARTGLANHNMLAVITAPCPLRTTMVVQDKRKFFPSNNPEGTLIFIKLKILEQRKSIQQKLSFKKCSKFTKKKISLKHEVATCLLQTAAIQGKWLEDYVSLSPLKENWAPLPQTSGPLWPLSIQVGLFP